MNFLYPLFLIAGISILIPIILHLFNFRKFQKVYFPNIQFLEQLKINTKKSAKLQQWAILLTRIALLLAAVFAFAQPFLNRPSATQLNKVAVLYLDNSMSMAYANSQKSNYSKAQEAAIQFIQQNSTINNIIIAHNDQIQLSNVLTPNEAIAAIQNIDYSAQGFSMDKLIQQLQLSVQQLNHIFYNIHIFTDVPLTAFQKKIKQTDHLSADFQIIDITQNDDFQNAYLDTVYFLQPFIDPQQPNNIVIKCKKQGFEMNEQVNLQLFIGQQMSAMTSLHLDEKGEAIDTLEVNVSGGKWEPLKIILQDQHYAIDDTFRLSVKTNPAQSCLIITEDGLNQYLQAAFNSFPNFSFKTLSASQALQEQLNTYSLCILQHQSNLPTALFDKLAAYIRSGNTVMWVPKLSNEQQILAVNKQLSSLADIRIQRLDTTKQMVNYINQHHQVLADVFANIPENVTLPITYGRLMAQSGLSANEEILMRYKDGKPFLANYQIGNGQLVMLYSLLDVKINNFVNTNYFAPIIYKLATLGSASFNYRQNVGSEMPIWIPESHSANRTQWKLWNNEQSFIPLQKPFGNGMQLYTQNAIKAPGFYYVIAQGQNDSFLIGFNADKTESLFEKADKATLSTYFEGLDFEMNKYNGNIKSNIADSKNILWWKWLICIGLAALLLETYLLYRKKPILQ